MTDTKCEPPEGSTDGAPAETVLAELVRCYLHWEPDARVLGNVRSADAVRAIREMWEKANAPAEVTDMRAKIARLEGDNEQLRATIRATRIAVGCSHE
jgi:hypothetical protein